MKLPVPVGGNQWQRQVPMMLLHLQVATAAAVIKVFTA